MNHQFIKTVIVEDEKNAMDALVFRLENNFQDIKIVGTAHNVKEGIKVINEQVPDLVFLDIALPDGNGFDILNNFGQFQFEIIFTTAFNEYAIKALKISALDYLLKPIDQSELYIAIEKFKSKHLNNQIESRINVFRENYYSTKSLPEKIVFSSANGFDIITLKDIIYCAADRNYTRIYAFDHKMYVVTQPLGQVEQLLSDYNFFRIHQSYLINLIHLKKFIRGKNAKVTLENNISLSVSQANRQELLKLISNIYH